jgi:uncharacterized protein YcgI (DUF1989 family)
MFGCQGSAEILSSLTFLSSLLPQGATRQVRFQPTTGKLMATSTGNSINVIDVEVGNLVWDLKVIFKRSST